MTIHLFCITEPQNNKYGTYQYSNQEIQKNFLVEFSNYDRVVWHHANSRGRVTSNPSDILIGEPPWPPPEGNPTHNWIFDNGLAGPETAHPNTFIVFPWGPATLSTKQPDPYGPLILASRALFGMAGVAHYDDFIVNALPESRWRRMQSKFVRINMGCDASLLPFRGASAKRTTGLLHVSSLEHYKQPDLMLASLPAEGCELLIATKRLDNAAKLKEKGLFKPNAHVIGPIDNGDAVANRFILDRCSYYLHTSHEAQATTILENCARGMVPIVTPQAGFSSPDAVYLTQDSEENQGIIRAALEIPEEEYLARSHNVRQHIRMYHSWRRICQHMYVTIQALMAGRDVDRRGEDYS